MPEGTKLNGTTIVGISTVEIPELESKKKKLSLTKPLPDAKYAGKINTNYKYGMFSIFTVTTVTEWLVFEFVT